MCTHSFFSLPRPKSKIFCNSPWNINALFMYCIYSNVLCSMCFPTISNLAISLYLSWCKRLKKINSCSIQFWLLKFSPKKNKWFDLIHKQWYLFLYIGNCWIKKYTLFKLSAIIAFARIKRLYQINHKQPSKITTRLTSLEI